MSFEECYQILNLLPGASKEEIKRAYWKQAKIYHPDVNNSEDAQIQFLRIGQAYDMLANGRYTYARVFYHPQGQSYYDVYRPETPQEKAARFAKMQYEEFKRNNETFKKSSIYLPFKIFTYLVCILGAFVAVGFILAPFLILFTNELIALAMFPIIFIGIAVMSGVFRLKSEVSRYF